ncbi:MAG: RNA polymerase sigma factor [Bacteroidota bacterium]
MTETEQNLINSAIRGDMDAFEQLIYKYDKHVLSIAYGYRINAEDAKDIYQEVFIRVLKGLSSFEFKSEFSTWLYRITVNVCLTYVSRRKKQAVYASIDEAAGDDEEQTGFRLPDELTDCNTADEILIGKETSRSIHRALETLSPQQKMVFTLKHLKDHKIKEIAEIMQCNEGTVKKYLFTAVHKLRDKLK